MHTRKGLKCNKSKRQRLISWQFIPLKKAWVFFSSKAKRSQQLRQKTQVLWRSRDWINLLVQSVHVILPQFKQYNSSTSLSTYIGEWLFFLNELDERKHFQVRSDRLKSKIIFKVFKNTICSIVSQVYFLVDSETS